MLVCERRASGLEGRHQPRSGSRGAHVRVWPCVVDRLQPYELDATAAACDVHLLDPVSFLAEQPIWGAYRSVSAGEIVGGVLSLAAGGDGKPTLSPLLPGLPAVRIAAGYRDGLGHPPACNRGRPDPG